MEARKQARAAVLEQPGQLIGIRPLDGAFDGHHLHASRAQHIQQRRIRRILHDDHVTGREQFAHDQVERLAGTLGGQHSIRINVQPVCAQLHRELFA